MPAEIKPKNETLRQAAVERMQLLGVPQEESFERVTRLAARLLAAPAAFFTLVEGERQMLKALVSPARNLEHGLLLAVSAQVLSADAPLLVEDARADERFATNPLIAAPKSLRFLAGVPVRSPELLPVGVLCVADTKPRKATGEEVKTLADLAAIIERELVLRAMLRTDPLTGLYNLRHFEVEIEREWRRASRSKSPISALLVNLDLMGDYNEIFGREKGDAALRRVAELLAQRFLRSSDLLVRFGSDEFLIVLPETGEASAASLADEIRELVSTLDIHHPYAAGKQLTVSIGCAGTASEAGFKQGPKGLLESTRAALATAKQAGRNRVGVAGV